MAITPHSMVLILAREYVKIMLYMKSFSNIYTPADREAFDVDKGGECWQNMYARLLSAIDLIPRQNFVPKI